VDWNAIQTPRFDRGCRRLTGIRQSGVLGSLAGELIANFPVGTELEAFDRLAFGLGDWCGPELNSGINAGLPGAVAVFNGTADQLWTVRTYIHAAAAGGWRLFVVTGNPVAGGLVFGSYTDPRLVGTPIQMTQSPAATPPAGQITTFTGPPTAFPYQLVTVVLPPGTAAVLLTIANNVAAIGHFEGSARLADASELVPSGI